MLARAPLLLIAVLLASCGSDPAPPPPPPEPAEVLYGTIKERDRSGKADGADFTALVRAQNAFALSLLSALRDLEPEKNLAVSGYSVHQVLAMLHAGAAGTTAEELGRVLGAGLPPERLHATLNALDLELRTRGDDVTLAIANRVWAQKGLPVLPAFLDHLTRHYGAPMAVTEFAAAPEAARAAINDWIRRATGDKIPELFRGGSINAQTRLVLANALYLDAPWKYKLRAGTEKQPFERLDGTSVPVPMMYHDDFLPSAADYQAGWAAVELPYRGEELAMVVIAPLDLRRFESRLTLEQLEDIFAKIKHGGIHLSIPRFKFSFHASLKETLMKLGLPSLFGAADLSGITGKPELSVEHFEHEVFVDVDEEGTKAAAASGAALPLSHGPTVDVRRPFLFAIRDRLTGALLFLGRVVDPSQG
jgi:serpin B